MGNTCGPVLTRMLYREYSNKRGRALEKVPPMHITRLILSTREDGRGGEMRRHTLNLAPISLRGSALYNVASKRLSIELHLYFSSSRGQLIKPNPIGKILNIYKVQNIIAHN